MLAPRQALGLSMALHEPATNAAKHGAPSGPGGSRWRGGATARMPRRSGWRPTVRPPERRGFGSRLLGAPLAAELGGALELGFASDRVWCAIRFPATGGAAPAPAGPTSDQRVSAPALTRGTGGAGGRMG